MSEENDEPAFPVAIVDKDGFTETFKGITRIEYARIHAPEPPNWWKQGASVHEQEERYFSWKKFYALQILK